MSLGVDGVRARVVLTARQHHLDLVGNGAREVKLQMQDVAEIPIITFTPKLRLITRLDELHRDPDSAACATHAALDDIVDPEFAADLLNAFWRGFVPHRRSARDHARLLGIDSSQLTNHFFSQTIGQVILILLSGQIFERQYGKHHSLRIRGRFRLRYLSDRSGKTLSAL